MTLNERLEKVLPSKYEVRDVFHNGGVVTVAYYTATDYDALMRAFNKLAERAAHWRRAYAYEVNRAQVTRIETEWEVDDNVKVLVAYEGN